MPEVTRTLESFWWAMAGHLWQTSLVLLLIWMLSRAMRRAPARYVHILWWIGLAKLLLPVALLAPLLRPAAVFLVGSPIQAPRVHEYATVALDPERWAATATGGGGSVAIALTLLWLAGSALLLALWCRRRAPRRLDTLETVDRLSRPLRSRLLSALEGTDIPAGSLRIGSSSMLPLVTGLARPRILLDRRVVEKLEPDELRAILLHEESHRRRRDPLAALAQRVALLTFFFYPPVWWVVHRLQETSELACDEFVLRRNVTSSLYGRALARALRLDLVPTRLPAAVGLGSRGTLGRRLERIENRGRFRTMKRHVLAILVAALAVLGSLVSVASMSPEPPGRKLTGLDRVEGLDKMIRLQFGDVPLEAVVETIAGVVPVRFKIEGQLPWCKILDYPEIPARDVLKRLAAEYGLALEVHGNDKIVVRHTGTRLAGVGDVTNPRLIQESKIQPVYPEEGLESRIQCNVILQEVVHSDGSVGAIEVLRSTCGIPSFEESAIAAVSRWRYEPARMDGQPVDVYFTVFVEFKLQ